MTLRATAWRGLLAGVVFLGLAAPAGGGREFIAGPVAARVLTVIDGDTLLVRARIWLGQEVETRVRLAGVDTPEPRGRCPGERALAGRARDFVSRLLATGAVTLYDVRFGKYGGRVLARVVAADGTDTGTALIAAGLARAYAGGKRQPWCS